MGKRILKKTGDRVDRKLIKSREKNSGGILIGSGNRKRVWASMAIFAALILALIGRLLYIQVFCHEDFEKATIAQYEMSIEGIDTRGQIFDRNMNPLTGGVYQYYYIIKVDSEDEVSAELFARINARQIGKKGAKYQVYSAQIYNDEVNNRLKDEYNTYVFRSSARYSDNQVACHLIGYLNEAEKRGVSGIEFLCEDKLKAGTNQLVLWADARGNILQGIQPAVVGKNQTAPEENSVITTLDIELQRKCERLLSGSAACIVADADTGEILALASSPTFNPNRISDYIGQDSDCLINKPVQGAYPPGSVFKLVVAAAALENNICDADKKFTCEGEIEIEGVKIACSTAPEGGHGEIDMYEATAKSCNCYYVQLGELVGYEKIISMARQLGLGEKVLATFPEESSGNVPQVMETGRWDIPNISIGQGELLATPLQIAKLTCTIAGGGLSRQMSIIKRDTYTAASQISALGTDDGDLSQSDYAVRVLSNETADTLQKLMMGVMTDGTASHIQWEVPVFGKSGTAEAVLRGAAVKNCWFTGFCEVEIEDEGKETEGRSDKSVKRYVITVFVEDGVSGSSTALPIFRNIVEYLDS